MENNVKDEDFSPQENEKAHTSPNKLNEIKLEKLDQIKKKDGNEIGFSLFKNGKIKPTETNK